MTINLHDRKTLIIGAVLLLVIIAGIGFAVSEIDGPVADDTQFLGNDFSFTYARAYQLQEPDGGVVVLGKEDETGFNPLLGVVRYKSDPQSPLPASFDAFVKTQARHLCGSDGPIEDVKCSNPQAEPYTTASSTAGLKLSMTLTRTNLTSGTTTTSTYEPLYAFNVTQPATVERPLRYEAVFVYPTLQAVLAGTSTPALMDQVMNSLAIPNAIAR